MWDLIQWDLITLWDLIQWDLTTLWDLIQWDLIQWDVSPLANNEED